MLIAGIGINRFANFATTIALLSMYCCELGIKYTTVESNRYFRMTWIYTSSAPKYYFGRQFYFIAIGLLESFKNFSNNYSLKNMILFDKSLKAKGFPT